MVDRKLADKMARQKGVPYVILKYQDGRLEVSPLEGLAVDPDKVEVIYYTSGR